LPSVADEELQDIEDIVNREVLRNEKAWRPWKTCPSTWPSTSTRDGAVRRKVRREGARDPDRRFLHRTLRRHAHAATGEIGLIKILREGSVSSGVRRLEAVAGEASLRHFRKDHELENMVSTLVGRSDTNPAAALRTEIERRDDEIKKLRKELDQARMKSASGAVSSAEDAVRR
jgi:alanyl-tRNA synthetase